MDEEVVVVKKKKALLVVIPTSLVIFTVFSPWFLMRENRILNEVKRVTDVSMQMDNFINDVEIIDYRGRWFNMYTKLELSVEKYNQLKQIFVSRSESSSFSTITNIKRMRGYHSMNLDDYEERFVAEDVYGEWFSTGETHYALVKEKSGNRYLYICA